jgi:hypothetical protein
MRCKEVQLILEGMEGGVLSAPVQEHLSTCADCREVRRDLWLMRSAFRALAGDPPPEPSFGFSTRVLRRLEAAAVDSGGAAAEYLERIGRRFVLAGLLLTMTLLLAFVLPSSGPLRGPSADESYLTQSDTNAPDEGSYLADEFGDTRDSSPANLSNGSGQTQK